MKRKNLKKQWKKLRKKLYKIGCSILATLLCVACGTTKVTVSQPTEGSYTTITVTTNNPITTTPTTDLNANLWDKK